MWQHTIRNACQDHILPHPLHNPITIFNINHNAHYTTLIADPNHFSYYDPLNFPIPNSASQIHRTLRQWYSNTAIAPPLLHSDAQRVTTKSTPKQTDNWSCGLHMLLINLAAIYQGKIPILRHTQAHAHQLSQIHLRYTLTGELDHSIAQIIQEIRKTDTTHTWPSPPLHTTALP